MARNRHNRTVRKVAGGYRSQGCRVRADVSGYPQPRTYRRRRPDVVARRGRDVVMVEVETRKSAHSDAGQRQVLRKFARRNNMRFRTVRA